MISLLAEVNVEYIEEGSLRLVGSTTQGRLEIYHDDRWGRICEVEFDLVDRNVACRQLGFTSALADAYPQPYPNVCKIP